MPTSTGRILAVDDDRFFREFYTDVLAKEGYEVDTAADGRSCMEKLAENAYDIVLLDLILGDTNGLELAERIRRENGGLEIIMATRVDDLVSMNKALALGIKEYIIKPVHEAELVQTVADVFERQRIFLEHGKLLAQSAEYFYTLSIYKRGLGILGTLEVDSLTDLMLEAFMEETEAAGALLWLSAGGQRSSFREAGRRGLIGADELASFDFSDYRHHEQLVQEAPFFPRNEDGRADRGAIHIPLIRNKDLLGIVKLVRKVGGEFRNKDLRTVRMLGEFSSVALQNAMVVQDLKRRSVRGEHLVLVPERFHDIVERERVTAARYSRSFSLVDTAIPLDEPELEPFLAAHLRDTDAVTRLPDGDFRFFLPETDGLGARSFGRRILGEIGVRAGKRTPVPPPVHAAFPADGEEMTALEKALAGRREVREWSRSRTLTHESFWSRYSELLEGPAPEEGGFDKNAFLDVVHYLFTELQSGHGRAALFLGLSDLGRHKAWLEERLFMAGRRARVCLFGESGDFQLPENFDNMMAIHVPSFPGAERYFALYVADTDGFVALYERGENGQASFSARDEFLADALTLSLQEQYFLQRQL